MTTCQCPQCLGEPINDNEVAFYNFVSETTVEELLDYLTGSIKTDLVGEIERIVETKEALGELDCA